MEEVFDQNSIDHAKTYYDNNNNYNNNPPPPLESPPSFASHTPLPPPLSLAMHHGHLALQQTQLTFNNNNNNNATYTHTTSTTGGEDAFNDHDISLDSTAIVRSANALDGGGGGAGGGEVVKRDLRITDSFAAPSITMVSTTTAATIVTKNSPAHGASKSQSSLPHQLPTLSHIGSGFSTGAFNTHIGGNGLYLGGHMGDSGISASSHLEPVRTNGSSFDELNFESNAKWDDGAAQSHGLVAITGGKSHLGASDGVHHAFVSPMLPPTLLAIAGQFPKQQGAVSKSSPDSTKGSSASRQGRRLNPSSNGGSSTEQNGVVASAQLQPPLTITDAGVEMNGIVGYQAARMPTHHFFNPKYLQKVERYNEKRTQQRAIGGDGDMSLSDREPPVIDTALGGGERGDEDGIDAKIKPPPPITTLWSELTGETDDATTTNTAFNCYGPGGSDSSFNFSSVNNVGRLAALSQRGRAVAVENKNNINTNNNDSYGASLPEAATSPKKGPFDYKVLVKNSVNGDARSANKGVEVSSAASPDDSAKT